MKVLFVAGFGPIVQDMQSARRFYGETLGLPLEGDDTYTSVVHDQLDGVKHFALWPLAGAAESCFGAATWPDDLRAPEAWVEFDVENVEEATAELTAKGYHVVTGPKQETWGQTVTRLLSPEGLLVGLTYTPIMRDE